MKHSTNNKTKLMALFAIVLLTISAMLVIVAVQALPSDWETGNYAEEQPVNGLPSGATPSDTVEVEAYLSFRPNPVGVNQWILINIWVTPPLNPMRFHQGYKVTITDPEGNPTVIDDINSYQADATAWFEYYMDEVGTWTLQFEFPGEYYPAGYYYNGYVVTNNTGTMLDSCYYTAASTGVQELEVTGDPVLSWPFGEPPTDYWTRPIHLENRGWWPIAGSYPALGVVGGGPYWPADTNKFLSNYDFIPYVQAPSTSHIVWKRQSSIAGIIGGPAGQYGNTAGVGTPDVIYAGRCYQTMTVPIDGVPTQCAACYDLRTGEMYYAIPTAEGGVTPDHVSYSRATGVAVPGATETNTYSVTLMSIGSRLQKINAVTGAVTLDVPGMAPVAIGGGFDARGGFVNDPYCLSEQNLGSFFNPDYHLINWTTAGNTDNFTERVVSNVSMPWVQPIWPGGCLGFRGTTYDFEANVAVWMVGIATAGTGHYYGTWIHAADLTTGDTLWNITVPDTRYSTSCFIADHGKVAVLMENGYWMAWNSRTGVFAWKSELMDYPWGQPSFGAYAVQSAYGLLYRESYDGVYAFNWTNGKIVWQYQSPSEPYETPYGGNNPFNAGGFIADGKLYTYNTEHTTTWPRSRGWKIHCINAKTGEGVWNLVGAMSPGAVADGYLAASNGDDGYMYVFGKGKSETTVTAPDVAVPEGTALTIKGTVLDMSPGQPGTPCVSADSMATQMEYLHMQLPIDGIWHNKTLSGVPVVLTAKGENGESYYLGTPTTEGYHGTFGLEWTPTSEGLYEIIASFEGDESYGSSSASTWVAVGPAPTQGQPQETEEPSTPPPTEEPTTPAPTEEPTTEVPTTEEPTTAPPTEEPSEEAPFPTTEVVIVAAIAVAAVIGIGAYWVLRRQK